MTAQLVCRECGELEPLAGASSRRTRTGVCLPCWISSTAHVAVWSLAGAAAFAHLALSPATGLAASVVAWWGALGAWGEPSPDG